MRQALDDLLCSRYPALYADRHASMSVTCMCWGFPEDGWFGIIDAVSEFLERDATDHGELASPARQVKEKFGSLRFYTSASERGYGAVRLAEDMSARVCEQSGRPGRLVSKRGWWQTLAPDLASGTAAPADGEYGIPAIGFTLADVISRRGKLLSTDSVIEVPTGWLDLADAVLMALAPNDDTASPIQVDSITNVDGVMHVAVTGGGERAEGIAQMVASLSQRIDPITGAMGPVDDAGCLIGS